MAGIKRTKGERERVAELLARRRRQLNSEGWIDTGVCKIRNLSRLYAQRAKYARGKTTQGDE